MKRLINICLLALVISSQGAASDAASDAVRAPDWTLRAPDGRQVNLAQESKKQTTILFFWATWCPYCKALMPHLQSMRLEYGNDIRILAINIKEDGDPVGFMESAGYDFTLLLDGDDVADLYEVMGTPGVFVVDAQQHIRFDLTRIPRIELPATDKPPGNSRKAAYMAPYWAAEIRKSLDVVMLER
ncbi:MAG: TlpA family protein disulfide reductase [Gammaproteobacteria bacterium]|nr:TlpA family protein disulfide reductase [Gammaproteobacteria bacterium]